MTGFRFLYPPECDPAQEVRMKSFDFIQALQIDDMVVLCKMTGIVDIRS
ncbi:MAG: hypothetical protein ACLUD0_09860 [Eubacterium ramulus]